MIDAKIANTGCALCFQFLLLVNFIPSGVAAELQYSCIKPPATVVEIAGIDTDQAYAKAVFTAVDIRTACNAGYVNQGALKSDACVRQMQKELIGEEITAHANCTNGTLKLTKRPIFIMPVWKDCASGGIFAAPAFQMLCPSYRGPIARN
jgi:hypothetical protein